jgi:hypothetical protein
MAARKKTWMPLTILIPPLALVAFHIYQTFTVHLTVGTGSFPMELLAAFGDSFGFGIVFLTKRNIELLLGLSQFASWLLPVLLLPMPCSIPVSEKKEQPFICSSAWWKGFD